MLQKNIISNIGESPVEKIKSDRKAKASGKFVAYTVEGQRYEIELDTNGEPHAIYKDKETSPLTDAVEIADVETEFLKAYKPA